MRRSARPAAALAAVLCASGCGAPARPASAPAAHAPAARAPAAFTPASPAVRRTTSGVTVTVRLGSLRGRPVLRARFRPDRPGFHLYALSLPPGGVDGLGVPTRLGVTGGLAAAGPATADRPVRRLRPAGLAAVLPVYPDGPVTVTLPVRRTGPPVADAVVGYGACSAAQCLMPVSGEHLRLPPLR